MVEGSVGRVALLSIHPRFAEAIFDGTKRVELRRIPVAADTTHVVVYATAPVGAVIGWFEVEGIDTDSRTAIWNTHRHHSGVSRTEYRAYFSGAPRASAIRIKQAFQLETVLALDALPGVKRPPQSYQYLAANAVRPLLQTSELVAVG